MVAGFVVDFDVRRPDRRTASHWASFCSTRGSGLCLRTIVHIHTKGGRTTSREPTPEVPGIIYKGGRARANPVPSNNRFHLSLVDAGEV